MNPPFVPEVLLAAAEHAEALLRDAEKAGGRLSFVVVVPAWRDCEYWRALNDSAFARPVSFDGTRERRNRRRRRRRGGGGAGAGLGLGLGRARSDRGARLAAGPPATARSTCARASRSAIASVRRHGRVCPADGERGAAVAVTARRRGEARGRHGESRGLRARRRRPGEEVPRGKGPHGGAEDGGGGLDVRANATVVPAPAEPTTEGEDGGERKRRRRRRRRATTASEDATKRARLSKKKMTNRTEPNRTEPNRRPNS